jgi:hypothetical protein
MNIFWNSKTENSLNMFVLQKQTRQNTAFKMAVTALFCILFIKHSHAQKAINLTLDIKEQKSYQYTYQCSFNNEFKIDLICSVDFKRNGKDTFIKKELVNDLKMYKERKLEFSLNTPIHPDSKLFTQQQFLKNLVIEQAIDSNGKPQNNLNIDSIIQNSPNAKYTDKDFIQSMELLIQKSENPFLNRELSKGTEFTIEENFMNLFLKKENNILVKTSYTIFDITPKQTIITGKKSFDFSKYESPKPKDVTSESLTIIENKTGLIIYNAEVLHTDNTSIIYVVSREDAPSINANIYFTLGKKTENSFSDDYNNILYMGNDKDIFASKKDAEIAIDSIKLESYIETDYNGNQNFYIASENDCRGYELHLSNMSYFYNDSTTLDFNIKDTTPFYIFYNYPYTKINDINLGKYPKVDKINCEINVKAGVTKKTIRLYPKDINKEIKMPLGNFKILSWKNTEIITTFNSAIKLYNKNNEQIEYGQTSFYNPKFSEVSKLLYIPEQEVTVNQAFLYSALLNKTYPFCQKINCKEDIAFIEITYPKELFNKTKRVSSSNAEKMEKKYDQIITKRLDAPIN